jgi:hypothetical protein
MVVALFSILVALFLGYGAVEELVVRGVRGGEAQPFVVGLAGIVVSVLLIAAGLAHWRRGPSSRPLLLVAALASLVFHVYAALPPHRNVGILALLVGAGYGLVLVAVALASSRPKASGPKASAA